MARLNVTAAAVCALALAPCLGGCAAAIIGGMAAAGGVGYQAAQERGLNGTFDDVKLKTDIGKRSLVLSTATSPQPCTGAACC